MHLTCSTQDLSPSPLYIFPISIITEKPYTTPPMRTALTILRALSTSFPTLRRRRLRLRLLTGNTISLFKQPNNPPRITLPHIRSDLQSSLSHFVEHLAGETETGDFDKDTEPFKFDASFGWNTDDSKNLNSPASLDVKELDELPEQWRRSKLAWLCKELPSHKPATLIRILNAQRKWVNQEDMTYVAVHCMRIRENETGFRVKISSLFMLLIDMLYVNLKHQCTFRMSQFRYFRKIIFFVCLVLKLNYCDLRLMSFGWCILGVQMDDATTLVSI